MFAHGLRSLLTVALGIRLANGASDYMACGILVPQAFSCRGMPEWAQFLEAVTKNRAEGFKEDPVLAFQAQEILLKWQDKPYPPQDFYKYLCTGPDAPWPLPDRFCLWGFVAALIIRARHLMGSPDPEDRKSAEIDFGYSTTVLGKEGAIDFLDSSPWPFSIIDAFLNINETQFTSYDTYEKEHPVTPPRVSLASLYWQPTVSLDATSRLPHRIRVAVVGSHATLSLEPVDMLRRFLTGTEIQPTFFGLESRWCNILGMCDQGTAALGQLFKDAEKDPYAFPWDVMAAQVDQIYEADRSLQESELIICTEPMAGCLMMLHSAKARGQIKPLLGYLGVALLNNCPPEDMDVFWQSLMELLEESSQTSLAQMAVNNLILSEQIYFQTGYRMPYVRAHGLYTNMAYAPTKSREVLVWRAPLFSYVTTRCAMLHFMASNPHVGLAFRFMEESESLSYSEVGSFKAVVLIPWDHALMTFYELYSAGIPLLMPGAEWMYRLLYQRGQLSVGERLYQSVMPGFQPPRADFADADDFKEKPGFPKPSVGLSSAKAARGVAEDVLTRGMEANDLDTAKHYLRAALELVQDMKYFLAVAENKTDEDSYTSMGVIRRSTGQKSKNFVPIRRKTLPKHAEPWHPYTPFQMSPLDSNDWTRMRKGTWWLRRGVRFDAMRYWYQYSDFGRFPGITYFSNLPDLLCMSDSLDVHEATARMRRHNEESLVHSAAPKRDWQSLRKVALEEQVEVAGWRDQWFPFSCAMAASSLLEIADNVATITLCREKEKNTMDAAMLGTLMDQLKQCMEDDAVHVIVLTNTGNTFCAGANLKGVGQAAPGGSSLVDILKFMQQGKKIIVGKINGHCTGGGVGLAAACDLSVIRGDAQVGFSEVRVGAAPAMISVICLPKMSRGKAAEMMLLGLKVPAQKATEAGLFNECVPPQDIDSKVEEWVDHLRHGGV
eukprot:symbB.v1.2.005249.t1/scaffold304.1/size234131/8